MESGATVWEIRELAKRIERGDLIDMVMVDEEGEDGGVFIKDIWRDAILVEALECLAAQRESERAVRLIMTGARAGEGAQPDVRGVDFPDTLDVNDNTYPCNARLEQIRCASAADNGAKWLVDVLPKLAEELAPYAVCYVTRGWSDGEAEFIIAFHTQGWSGAEDLIDAVLSNVVLNLLFYSAWKTGGHFEFRVSERLWRGGSIE